MARPGVPPDEIPVADVTARMAIFGRMFGERAAAAGRPPRGQHAANVVELVRANVPRSTRPSDDAPVFEAAAFIGEWVRARVPGAWVVEGAQEPHLRVEDPSGTIIYVLPLVNVVRIASTAGYDGLAALLEGLVEDISDAPLAAPLAQIRVRPLEDRPRVAAWIATSRGREPAAVATLWRRCSSCSTLAEDALALPDTSVDVETLAAFAANALAQRPFACVCGGPPGDASRFLMLRREGEVEDLFVDISITAARTRIASWRVEADRILPLGVAAVAREGQR